MRVILAPSVGVMNGVVGLGESDEVTRSVQFGLRWSNQYTIFLNKATIWQDSG